MKEAVFGAVFCLLLVGCGGSPGAPSGADVTGDWSGQIVSQDWGTASLQMSLAQAGTSVTGSWRDPNESDAAGSVSGTVSGRTFAGTMSLEGCSGGATISGAVGGSQMTWSSSQGFIVSGFECSNDRAGFTLTVTRK